MEALNLDPTTKDKKLIRPATREQLQVVKEDVRKLGGMATDDVKTTAVDTYEELRTRGRQIEGRMIGVVRKRPLASVATAAGLGAVLGFLLRRN